MSSLGIGNPVHERKQTHTSLLQQQFSINEQNCSLDSSLGYHDRRAGHKPPDTSVSTSFFFEKTTSSFLKNQFSSTHILPGHILLAATGPQIHCQSHAVVPLPSQGGAPGPRARCPFLCSLKSLKFPTKMSFKYSLHNLALCTERSLASTLLGLAQHSFFGGSLPRQSPCQGQILSNSPGQVVPPSQESHSGSRMPCLLRETTIPQFSCMTYSP